MEKRSPRRSRRDLEEALQTAESQHDKAIAHFQMGLFHDNNSREREAIPHYEAALAFGLESPMRAECLSWLASSLYKTGRHAEATERLAQARAANASADLRRFLDGLERRMRRRTSSQ